MTFAPAAFFDACRIGVMGPTLDQGEVDGANAILSAMDGCPRSWTAYALATAWHETAHTLKPIREANWLSDAAANRYFFRMYDIDGQRPQVARRLGNTQPGDGAKFCGRGYVQLTGRTNYAKAGREVGAPLESNPALALRADIAAKIMRHGMTEGWFTGKAFRDYLGDNADSRAFARARRIINGQDRAQLIAGYAVQFQDALAKGGWA